MIRRVHTSNRRERKKAMHSRAWLNGVEVTSQCFYADDRAGVVRLYRLNAAGQKYVTDRHDVAKEERHGKVRIGRQ